MLSQGFYSLKDWDFFHLKSSLYMKELSKNNMKKCPEDRLWKTEFPKFSKIYPN